MMRATMKPLARFRKVNGRVRLRHGDIVVLAEETGRSGGHISRVIAGERASDELRAQIEAMVGVAISQIDLPRKATDAA